MPMIRIRSLSNIKYNVVYWRMHGRLAEAINVRQTAFPIDTLIPTYMYHPSISTYRYLWYLYITYMYIFVSHSLKIEIPKKPFCFFQTIFFDPFQFFSCKSWYYYKLFLCKSDYLNRWCWNRSFKKPAVYTTMNQMRKWAQTEMTK